MSHRVCGKLLTLKFYELCSAIVPAQGSRYMNIYIYPPPGSAFFAFN